MKLPVETAGDSVNGNGSGNGAAQQVGWAPGNQPPGRDAPFGGGVDDVSAVAELT